VTKSFEQLQALMNALIYNEELRKEMIKREYFWLLISDIVSILKAETRADMV
jgi:hypothetical protein